jgi:hypothetical protein
MLVYPMETPVEIRYAGVVVARSNEARRMSVGGVDYFLAMSDPLPAGTVISLGDTDARVEKVVESQDPTVSGVYVKLLADGDGTLPWVPCFREAEVPAPRPPAVVVSPIVVRPVHTPAPPRPAPPPPPVVAPRREETPLPEVVAILQPPPLPPAFTAPLPRPNEKVAHFDPSDPPPAVVESVIPNDRRRATIVMSVPPPTDPRVPNAVGEIDTGSRRINAAPSTQPASIVVEEEQDAASPSEAAGSDPAELNHRELRLEDLPPARALPSARARATKRRKTTTR